MLFVPINHSSFPAQLYLSSFLFFPFKSQSSASTKLGTTFSRLKRKELVTRSFHSRESLRPGSWYILHSEPSETRKQPLLTSYYRETGISLLIWVHPCTGDFVLDTYPSRSLLQTFVVLVYRPHSLHPFFAPVLITFCPLFAHLP